MGATLAVLLVGIGGFVQGGSFNERYGNKLMQARVGLQLVAVHPSGADDPLARLTRARGGLRSSRHGHPEPHLHQGR